MKRVIVQASSCKKKEIKSSCNTKESVCASVDWGYFDQFDYINNQYLPDSGEGSTMATQICTALNKLVYKWYNDGDVFDNTHGLEGWANDLSSYANWLYKHVPASKSILDQIFDIYQEGEYENLLAQLCDTLFDAEDMENYDKQPKQGSVYNCDGPFVFEEYEEEEDDDYYEEDYYDDEEY